MELIFFFNLKLSSFVNKNIYMLIKMDVAKRTTWTCLQQLGYFFSMFLKAHG